MRSTAAILVSSAGVFVWGMACIGVGWVLAKRYFCGWPQAKGDPVAMIKLPTGNWVRFDDVIGVSIETTMGARGERMQCLVVELINGSRQMSELEDVTAAVALRLRDTTAEAINAAEFDEIEESERRRMGGEYGPLGDPI